jgi:hypothetical protein
MHDIDLTLLTPDGISNALDWVTEFVALEGAGLADAADLVLANLPIDHAQFTALSAERKQALVTALMDGREGRALPVGDLLGTAMAIGAELGALATLKALQDSNELPDHTNTDRKGSTS